MNAWSRWLSNPLVSGIAILILVGGLIGTVGLRLFDGVSTLRSAPHDNLQWSLAQLEVELLTFSNAVKTARASEDGLDDVRRRFDVFYSRVNTITTGSVFADLREQPAAGRMLTTITRFLDDTIPLIDGPDAGLRDGLPALDTRIREMRAPARSLAVEGVRLFARLSDTRRIGFEKLLLTASVIAVGMILLLGLTLAFLSRQHGLSLRSAAETRRSEERLSSAINASLDAIVIVDEAGKLIEYNQAAEQVFGRPREKAIGADMAEMMIPHQYREAHALGMARFRSTGEKNVVDKGRFELSALHADGREFPVELSIGSAQGDSGSIFIAYLRDITERRAAEDALKAARDEAMAADRAKSEFIAVMSHEMRTPLNGLLGVLDLMRGTDLDQRQRGYVDVAASSGELLLRHINDVLDIARLEAEGTQLEEAAFDLEALVSSVVEVNRPAAEAKGIAMRVEIDPPAAPLLGDVHRLRQILMNLLGNAVKFTSRGEIRVEAIAEDEGPEGALLTLAVTDTGAGISAADQERIFDDFVTLDPSYSRKATGSGLGLSICRRLASVMGGTIRVESAVGVGSRFWLTVQLQHADPADAPVPVIAGDTPRVEPVPPAPVLSATAETAAGAKAPREANGAPHPLAILLVEDNETNRFIVREMLDGSGYAVDEACNGQEGVERAAARAYDLILMDISMPVMNGIDATRAIRAGGLSQNATIIGATAHALPEERALFAEAGMQECLAKPIRMETLLATLDRVASSGAAGWAQEEDVTPEEDLEDEDDLFDDETLGDLTAGLSPERAHRFFTKLADEIEREIARFDEADPENLRAEAHRLAGSAAIAGASALHQALADLETDVARGRLDELPAAIVHARTIARPTVEVLRELAGPATGEAGKEARA